MTIEVRIRHAGVEYSALVEEGVKYKMDKAGYASSLGFNVINDGIINFTEGDRVALLVNEKKVFLGYVFSKSRGEDNIIEVLAYDQIRYLKNKDTIFYVDMKASDIFRDIATRNNLVVGTIEDTKYVLPDKIEEDSAYIDILFDALEKTKEHTEEEFVIYDDFGELNLVNVTSLKTNVYICEDNMCGYTYKSSIDENVYNKIKVVKNGNNDKDKEVYEAFNQNNINTWGLLQNVVNLTDEATSGQAEADFLLKRHNIKYRKLSLKDVIGNIDVRAGSLVMVNLKLGDVVIEDKYMRVNKCTHKFDYESHFMDLEVSGGIFDGEESR